MAEKSQYTESNTEFKRNGNSLYNGEFISHLLEKNFLVIKFENSQFIIKSYPYDNTFLFTKFFLNLHNFSFFKFFLK